MGYVLPSQICHEFDRLMLYCRVTLVTFRVLEPYAVKVASTVLRRERRGNPPDLSGVRFELASRRTLKNF